MIKLIYFYSNIDTKLKIQKLFPLVNFQRKRKLIAYDFLKNIPQPKERWIGTSFWSLNLGIYIFNYCESISGFGNKIWTITWFNDGDNFASQNHLDERARHTIIEFELYPLKNIWKEFE